jgi:hypothetical protein
MDIAIHEHDCECDECNTSPAVRLLDEVQRAIAAGRPTVTVRTGDLKLALDAIK